MRGFNQTRLAQGTAVFLQVMVMSVGKEMQQERLKLANELWEREIGANFTHSKANPFLPEQISYATQNGIPLAVIMAPRELGEASFSARQSETRCVRQRIFWHQRHCGAAGLSSPTCGFFL